MPTVKYTDDSRWQWAVLVSDGTPESNYSEGALLSSTDLTSLGLTTEKTRMLHNALVQHDLYAAPLLMGKRAILKKILTELGIKLEVRVLLNLFQQAYYGEGTNV